MEKTANMTWNKEAIMERPNDTLKQELQPPPFPRMAWLSLFAIICLSFPFQPSLSAHHFKGLPHYNYFDNYPQVPEEEFLGQAGEYEFSLVVYDFQGITRENAEDPDNVRFFLVIFNLLQNKIYKGPLTMTVLDDERVVYSTRQESAELENLYSFHRSLPNTGDYSLKLILHDENDLECVIPFRLSSQIIHWGKWIGGILALVIAITAVGARKARVARDRQAAMKSQAQAKAKVKAQSEITTKEAVKHE